MSNYKATKKQVNLMAVAVGREDDNDTLVAWDASNGTFLDDDMEPVENPCDAMTISTDILDEDPDAWEHLARENTLQGWVLGDMHEDAYGTPSFELRPSTLADLRKRQHITQVDLAERVGVGQSQIADWERGRNVPSVQSCVKLALALGVDAGVVVASAMQSDR